MVVNHVSDSCIGAPVYFFFTLNTARLTDVSQKLNLDELARVAKKYDLHVKSSLGLRTVLQGHPASMIH